MNTKIINFCRELRSFAAITCMCALLPGDVALAQQAQAPPPDAPSASQAAAVKIPAEQLDSLVAPIALYPDPRLAPTLVASTYPLELAQLQQWLEKHKNLKDKALVDAVTKESWDASIKAMAALPAVVKRLADDIQWTTDLGNAFLAQQSEVMDAVQRMRKKAQDKGNLKPSEQQKVETKMVESKQVIVIEQASPQVVYVPSYDPVVVYGAPYYPYPPIYYPSAGYYAAGMAISFGVGVAMGAAWGGGWGWNSGWGGNNDININRNNNFNRTTNVGSGNRGNGNGGKWQHNPQHRGGAPYGDRSTAQKFGGSARGDSLSSRQAGAPDQVSRQGGNPPSSRSGGDRSFGGGSGERASSSSSPGGRSGADRAGSRDLSRGSSSRSSSSGFGGGSGGFSGSSARSSSSRGASSMSRGGGGGRTRGGGGRR